MLAVNRLLSKVLHQKQRGRALKRLLESEVGQIYPKSQTLLNLTCRTYAARRQYLSRMDLTYGFNRLPVNKALACQSSTLMTYYDMIHMCSAGTFIYLPQCQRALEKLIALIDYELQAIDAQKISMPSLIPIHYWKKSGRWEEAGKELFRLQDRHKKDYCLGPTHEEVITDFVAALGNKVAHRRLPVMLYQITKKFRDEMVPKYGLLRCREFEMKDLYTFDKSIEDAKSTYELVCETYAKIFTRLKLNYVKVSGDTGNIGGHMSHEYHLVADIGEDTIYICDKCGYGSNSELIDSEHENNDQVPCPTHGCNSSMTKSSGIEVGHAFLLGTKYSEKFKAQLSYVDGTPPKIMEMGCYGLGVSRIVQASIESLTDSKNIKWPGLIAPYQVLIAPEMKGEGKAAELADTFSDSLQAFINLRGEVVIDDNVKPVGFKVERARAHGYPYIIPIGKKTMREENKYELVDTTLGCTEYLTRDQLFDKLSRVETINSLLFQ